jgi:hypothetical protein
MVMVVDYGLRTQEVLGCPVAIEVLETPDGEDEVGAVVA